MSRPGSFAWRDAVLTRLDAAVVGDRVVVADSWLVSGGLALAVDVHRERFLSSVDAQARGRRSEAEAFWRAACAEMPATGSWSPRVELSGTGDTLEFRLRLRPAPPLRESVRLVTASHDPREQPTVKGPDLERLAALRTEAEGRGADEAVILSPDGTVVEGDYTSLVWWRGDALCTVADAIPRLPGVTEKSLVTLATALGVEVLPDEVLPEELDGLEVWALNSLQGIRIATQWIDGPTLAEQPGRLRLWRARLDRLRRPVA